MQWKVEQDTMLLCLAILPSEDELPHPFTLHWQLGKGLFKTALSYKMHLLPAI